MDTQTIIQEATEADPCGHCQSGDPATQSIPPGTEASPGFTLVELLAVIAILGILAAILVPTTTAARAAAGRAKTRTQYAQWAAAIELFRQEYGVYPIFETTGPGANKVNGNTVRATDPSALHLFHDTLAGSRRDGSPLPAGGEGNPPPPQVQNPRRIAFYTFSAAEIIPGQDAGAGPASQAGNIRDAFDNPDIAVLVDRNLDGAIRIGADGGDGIAVLPLVSPLGLSIGLAPDPSDFPAIEGVRAGVIFYSAPPYATTAADLLMSWK